MPMIFSPFGRIPVQRLEARHLDPAGAHQWPRRSADDLPFVVGKRSLLVRDSVTASKSGAFTPTSTGKISSRNPYVVRPIAPARTTIAATAATAAARHTVTATCYGAP